MPSIERHLVGPNLLIELCFQTERAMEWAQTVGNSNCVLSSLAIAIVKSVINANAKDAISRDEWLHSLDAVVARMLVAGADKVDVNETILDRYHLYRLHSPLDSNSPTGPVPVEQDVRLLITTAAVMDLVYTEISDLYLEHMQAIGVRVQVL